MCAAFYPYYRRAIYARWFLTPTQRHDFGRFVNSPSRTELDRYFYLSDDDQKTLLLLRGDHNRLGYAIQLTCVRYLGDSPMT